jgi:hypothetical protein
MRFPKLLSVTYILITGLIVLSIADLHGQQHHHDPSCCDDSTHVNTDIPGFQRCASTLYRNLEESRNPGIREIRERLEMETRIWLERNIEKSQILNEVITIPVVVHVVYNRSRPEQNISDEQIFSQIEALNVDFRRLNSDTVNTPELFRNLAADTYIQFQLAQRTPDGLPTNGITRTVTDIEEFSFDSDNIKFDNTGGKNIWNRDRYMNIWVCNLEQNYLGYAQYPGGNAATDGIVISYRNFGTTGTAQFPFNLGRTVTHEVGHWLNLVHTWGDEDNCNATDYVSDTPTQESAYYHCPGFPQVSCDSEDMFMNYMDYTDDRCMNLFTAGQSHRMHATLNGFRAPIKNSDALVAPQFTNLICDTLNSALKSADLYLYLASDGGYATGTNAYNDKAKAQYFENTGEFTIAKGGAFAFGAAHDKGGTAYAAIWELATDRKPGTNAMRKTPLAISKIENDLQNDALTHFSFEPAVAIDGPFFMGVILPVNDTLALLASDFTDVTHAWEQWNNNVWYNFKDSWNGTLNVNLAVFPLVCRILPPWEPGQIVEMKLGPNPLTINSLNLHFSNYSPDWLINIEIYDITGRRVYYRQNHEINSRITLDLSSITYHGMFLIRIYNEHFGISDKFLRINTVNQ